MSINIEANLRRRKPEKRLQQIQTRPLNQLVAASSIIDGRPSILLDTNVYISDAGGNLPKSVSDLVDRSVLFHCSVCLGELTTGIANGNPQHNNWADTRDHYVDVINAMPETRILTPDASIWLDAGIISGTLARTQGFQPYQRKEVLNDALIFLTAARYGIPVLTSNRDEFDLIQQLSPEGNFIHY